MPVNLLLCIQSLSMIQDRGNTLESSQNCSRKPKNTRNLPNSLSNSQRLQTKTQLSSEKLQFNIKELNQKGLKAKEASDYAQALIYFQQCERLLEMGADCGKSIDRSLILIVLSNEAFAYHKLNILQNAKKYLEAAIFNIHQFLDDLNQLSLEHEIQRCIEGKKIPQEQNTFLKTQTQRISTLITRKKELVVAQMQYAELLAEGSQHQLAAQTAEKAIDSLQKYISILWEYKLLTKSKSDSGVSFLQTLLNLQEQFKKQTIQSLSASIKQASSKETAFNYQNANPAEKTLLNGLKLQDFLIMKTKSFSDHTYSNNLFNIMDLEILKSTYLMDLVILMVYLCLHFIIGAESLQYSRAKEAVEKETLYILEEEGLEQKQSEFRNKKAQKHYLFSILLILKYLPHQSLLSQLKEIYKSAFEEHYETLWVNKPQAEEQEQQFMQMMDIGFSARISCNIGEQPMRQMIIQEDKKLKETFTLKVPNTNDKFLFDMASIDSIQCLSANSSIINMSHNQGHPMEETRNQPEAESYFKNPTKSTKYNPLFMGTWDLRQFQKLNKSSKPEEKSENTQKTCQKTIQKETKEVKHVEAGEQKQIFQIIIHTKQKERSLLKSQQIKQALDLDKMKIQRTQANSVNQQSVKNKQNSKKKMVKNPEHVRQKSKSKDCGPSNSKHQKNQLRIPNIKVKFNKAKSPVVEIPKKPKNSSKDVKLKKNTKSKSKNKPTGNEQKSKAKSLNKRNLSPSKNVKGKLESIYYQKK